MMATSVFQVHLVRFIEKINLDTLAPMLYSRRLLTAEEYEAVTYIHHLPNVRKRKLVQYLESKGEHALPRIVECLREEASHPPHAELVGMIEEFQSTRPVNSPALLYSCPPIPESVHHLQPYNILDVVEPPSSFGSPFSLQSACREVTEGVQSIQTGRKREHSSNSTIECDHAAPPVKRPNCDVTPTGTRKISEAAHTVHYIDQSQMKQPRHQSHTSAIHTHEDVATFSKFQHISPHEFAQQYIPHEGSVTSPSCDSRPGTSLPESLQILAKSLKATYCGNQFFRLAAGPSVGKIQFINLALVQKQGVNEAEKELDAFLKSTLHGAIDDIMKKKVEITIEEIFKYSSEGRKLVLVEGAPGVGKTMLAMKLCVDWASGKHLQEYDLVLLVQLKRFQAFSELNVEDLLGIFLGKGETARQASDDLLRKHSNVLLILEGWDELPPNLRKEMTFFFDIVQAYKLPEASVMVTSRPSVTASLYDYFDERHIEVLGFTHTEINKYIKQHTSSSSVAEVVLDHLKRFPNLRALAHIPLTLAIICNLLRHKSTLPPTLTELYQGHICNTLHQNLKYPKQLDCVTSIDELDEGTRGVVNCLGSLALNGFKEKKFVFSREDLQQVGLKETLSSDFDGYGLLSTIQVPVTAGHNCFYQFRHLSIQEYLAAFNAKELVKEERLQLLKEYRGDRQFQNVWKFLSGITKLREESVQELIITETNQANRAQLFLLHCLYEAHSPQICEVAATKVQHTINLSNINLNTTDCLCVAYVIAGAGGEWVVNLRGANIGEDGLEVFDSYILNYLRLQDSETTELKIKKLDLAHNRITGDAIFHLAEVVKSELHLEQLDLASNKIRDSGMETLACALARNHTVTHLHFSSCDLKVHAAKSIGDMLITNNALKDIYLGFENIGDEGVQYIANALKENYALKELALTRTRVTIVGLRAVAEMMAVNRTLEVIRFDRNDLGPNECGVVADIIAKSDSIVLIDLSKNPIGDGGFEIVLKSLIQKPKASLKKLGVYGCKITHKSLFTLVDLFAVTETFAGLQLGFNDIGDEGAELIGKALEMNKSQSVKNVLLESSGVSEKGKKKLEEVQKSLGRDPDDLDINFTLNSQVKKRREEKY